MANKIDQLEVKVPVDTADEGVETLREILTREQLEPVSYEEAKALGYDLMTFFEIFDEPSEPEDESGGGVT